MQTQRSGYLAFVAAFVLIGRGLGSEAATFQTNDVVAFVGGAALVSIEQAGAVETLLTMAHPAQQLRFRSLAWEGDTVYARPRDVHFPSLAELLKRHQATVAFVQFGAMESFQGGAGIDGFRLAYGRLLDEIRVVVPRLIVVTPTPFEAKAPPLPDLGSRNETLARYAAAAQELAVARGFPVVDLFDAMSRRTTIGSWTTDGRDLSLEGHQLVASVWARELGRAEVAEAADDPKFWRREDVVRLRAAIADKNRLWFDYWRPMNWAFLYGDRMEQPSSRDHRDLKLRWFPVEMQQFIPLIAEAEVRVGSLAAQVEQRR